MMKGKLVNLRWLSLSLFIIFIDQLTKWYAFTQLPTHPVHVMPSLNFVLTFNPGMVFSFLHNVGFLHQWLLIIISIIISSIILIWLYRLQKTTFFTGGSLAFILGGAISNLIDRFILGHVIDFIQLYYQQWYWPIFNIADMSVSLGAALMIIALIRQEL